MMYWMKTYGSVGAPKRPDMKYIYAQAKRVQDAMRRQATKLIPGVLLQNLPAYSFALYATAHETGFYDSPLYRKYNNASGIKYAGQKGAKKGTNGYAWFDTLDDWARAYIHELTKGSAPAKAATLEDFADRLKKNGYYTDSVGNYLTGMRTAKLVLKTIPEADRATGQDRGVTDADIQAANKKRSWFREHPIWTGSLIALGGVLVIRAVSND